MNGHIVQVFAGLSRLASPEAECICAQCGGQIGKIVCETVRRTDIYIQVTSTENLELPPRNRPSRGGGIALKVAVINYPETKWVIFANAAARRSRPHCQDMNSDPRYRTQSAVHHRISRFQPYYCNLHRPVWQPALF